MLARIRRSIAVAAALILVAAPVQAEKRVALVIGNSAYTHAPKLATAASDAADMAAALRETGFAVIERRDADRPALTQAVDEFASLLRDSEVAVFYYAGRAVQIAGVSYLLPIDADIKAPGDLPVRSVDLSRVIGLMDGTKAGLVFLDAGRNNPFPDTPDSVRSSKGPATPSPSRGGMLIAFATAPGGVPVDATGRNSPYTTALLEHMRTPGLEVHDMLSRVRRDVMGATNGKQIPWESSSLSHKMYFVPATSGTSETQPSAPAKAR